MLRNYLPHYSFLVVAGVVYIIYLVASLVGYSFAAGVEAQDYVADEYPLP